MVITQNVGLVNQSNWKLLKIRMEKDYFCKLTEVREYLTMTCKGIDAKGKYKLL